MIRCLYLIKRKPDRPAHYHESVPYHPVIICTNAKAARWEAKETDDEATVWQYTHGDLNGSGWLIVRWRGLDIDYGCLVRGFKLPDGSHSGFYHPHAETQPCGNPWEILKGALWFSSEPMPKGVAKAGVILFRELGLKFVEWTKGEIERTEDNARDPHMSIKPIGYRYTLKIKSDESDVPAEARLFS